MFFSGEALTLIKSKYPSIESVFDLGCGDGKHMKFFKENFKNATYFGIDIYQHANLSNEIFFKKDITEFLQDIPASCGRSKRLFWLSHVIEHQENVGTFLNALLQASNPGDLLAITVPPLKHQIVGGHVSLWNAGLLLYRLVLAGFDCRKAHVKKYGYNISVVVEVAKRDTGVKLCYDRGDIWALDKWFPMKVTEGFNGNIDNINWE